MPRYLLLSLLALVLTGLVGCTNKTTKISGPTSNGGKSDAVSERQELVAALNKEKVADSGQAQVVADFISSLRRDQGAGINGLISSFVANEISAQYGNSAAYAKAFNEQEAKQGAAQPFADFPDSYQKNTDLGTFLIYTLGNQSDAARIAFYLEQIGGGWKIDNILTADALQIGISAPALGMSQHQPVMAFYSYHNAAIFAQHPPTLAAFRALAKGEEAPTMPWSGKSLSTKERLAYLRQGCTQEYIDNIATLPGGKDLIGFLNTGKRELLRAFEPAEVIPHDGNITEIHVRLAPKSGVDNAPSSAIIKKTQTLRRHGQWQLSRDIP